MPYVDYDAARAEFARVVSDPFSFTLGGEDFTVLEEPMFGDLFELYEAPPPDVNEDAAVFALMKFVKRLLHPNDRTRFEKALYLIPQSHVGVLMKLGTDLSEHFTAPFLNPPHASSPRPRRSAGATRKANGGGKKAS